MRETPSSRAGLPIALALSAVFGLSATASAAGLGVDYTDDQDKFSISFPGDWARVSYEGGPDFQIVSNKGVGPEECNLIVEPATGRDQLNNVNSQAMRAALNVALVAPELVAWKKVTRDRRTAIRYTFIAGREGARQGTLGLQVVSGGKHYTLTCNAPLDVFADREELFSQILASLDFE